MDKSLLVSGRMNSVYLITLLYFDHRNNRNKGEN
jgi:hypothetical protein